MLAGSSIYSDLFMKTILVLGAGRSSSALISYLLKIAEQQQWHLRLGDVSLQAARARIGNSRFGEAHQFSIDQEADSHRLISEADVVISLLPAQFHPRVARYCLQWKKHLLTASYVSEEMKTFNEEAKHYGLLFLNECGLDPGIDHMSAMQVIDGIKSCGGKLISFESFTGGLIAPDTDLGNPWRYKFTWNPRNVVMAGQGTARFLQQRKYKYVPYQQLFERTTAVHVEGYGDFEGYANRDSLSYINTYGLQGIQTMIRGTLRNKGYCRAWNILVQLGCCDDSFQVDDINGMTHANFIDAFLPAGIEPVETKLMKQFGLKIDAETVERLRWSGFFSDELIGMHAGTPAQITEHILNKRWRLKNEDKDFIMMWHRFVYEQQGTLKEVQAHMAVTGQDAIHTAMATTVGLPLAIAAKLLLTGRLQDRGVVIPVIPSLYKPILSELKMLGIELVETHISC